MTFVRRAAALMSLAMVLGVAACGPDGPAIQEISPGKGDVNVAADAPIRVTFNHDMDRPSVEARFSVTPAIAGCSPASCPFTWSGRTLTMQHPRHQFATETKYRVTLKPGYADTTGRTEGLEHFWEFQTETAPALAAVSPADGATGVAVDADLSVQLNRPVLAPAKADLTLASADDAQSVTTRVTVAPDDSRRLLIAPLGLLRPRTAYTLHVGAGVEDVHHNLLGSGHDIHFTTGSLDLTHSLAFLVRDSAGGTASRVAELRPPAGLGAAAPSLRLLYTSPRPILAYGWAADAASLYVLDSRGTITAVPLNGATPQDTGLVAAAMSVSPARTELAYVAARGTLHLWGPTGPGTSDLAVGQAGHVVGTPAWSGDGRRLAFVVDDPGGGLALRLLDRETLSVATLTSLGSISPPQVALAWSNDGNALAFTRAGAGLPEVWTYHPLAAQGNGLQRVGPLGTTSLSWSSDGGLLFGAGRTSAGGQALIQQALGARVEGQPAGFSPVRGSRSGDTEPRAPANDRRVAFVRPAAGQPQLWIMNNDGTGVAQLTFASYDREDRFPASGVDEPLWGPGA